MWYSIVEMCMGFIKLQHKSSVFWVIVHVGIVRQMGRHIIASSYLRSILFSEQPTQAYRAAWVIHGGKVHRQGNYSLWVRDGTPKAERWKSCASQTPWIRRGEGRGWCWWRMAPRGPGGEVGLSLESSDSMVKHWIWLQSPEGVLRREQ